MRILGPFHVSAYRKHGIGAYRSREFFAYGKRISQVNSDFWPLRVRTSTLTRHRNSALACKRGIVIVSAEFGGKQSHAIGPWSLTVTNGIQCL